MTPGRQARPRRDIPELGHTGLRQGRCPSPGAVLARHMAPKAHAPVSAACRRLGHSDQPPIAMPRVQRPFQVPGKLHAPIPVLSLPCPSLRFPAQAACDEGLCPVCHLCPLSGEEALTRPQLLSAPVSHGHGPWRQTTGSRWSQSPTSWVASSGAPPLSLRLLTESRGHSRTHPMGCREVLSWRPGRRVIVGCGVCSSSFLSVVCHDSGSEGPAGRGRSPAEPGLGPGAESGAGLWPRLARGRQCPETDPDWPQGRLLGLEGGGGRASPPPNLVDL